jgi:type I restriction-modification system DNA methylase subunit
LAGRRRPNGECQFSRYSRQSQEGYVDTFEEEEPVDIDAAASELKELETEMQATDDIIAEFCKELNIPTPF